MELIMKLITDWFKYRILLIAMIPHTMVLAHRVHRKAPGNIYEDRPLWVIKVLATRITSDFFDEDEPERAMDAMYRLTNEACIELKRRNYLEEV